MVSTLFLFGVVLVGSMDGVRWSICGWESWERERERKRERKENYLLEPARAPQRGCFGLHCGGRLGILRGSGHRLRLRLAGRASGLSLRSIVWPRLVWVALMVLGNGFGRVFEVDLAFGGRVGVADPFDHIHDLRAGPFASVEPGV